MQENIYAAPSSNLVEDQTPITSQHFYVVSKVKFFSLFFLTFGVYSIYWHFKNWKIYKQQTNEKLLPIMRALFSIFFTHALFRAVDDRIKASGNTYDWNYHNWASLVVLTAIVSNVLDRLSDKNIGSPYTDIVALAFLPLLGLVTYKGQIAINIACNDPLGQTNKKFTPWNYLWMSLMPIMFVLGVLGALFLSEK